MLGKKKSAIGLDIGSSSAKVVEIEDAGEGALLVNFGIEELLPEAIVDGEIMDRQVVVDSIRNLIESRSIKEKRVVTIAEVEAG